MGHEERLPPRPALDGPRRPPRRPARTRSGSPRPACEHRDESLRRRHEEVPDRRLPGPVDGRRPQDRVRDARDAGARSPLRASTARTPRQGAPRSWVYRRSVPARSGRRLRRDEDEVRIGRGTASGRRRCVPEAFAAMYSASFPGRRLPRGVDHGGGPTTRVVGTRHPGRPPARARARAPSHATSSGRRTRARTRYPAARSASATWLPTKPVPPVRATRSPARTCPLYRRTKPPATIKQLPSPAAATLAPALPAPPRSAAEDRRLRHPRHPRSRHEAVKGTRRSGGRTPPTVPVAELSFHLYWNAFRNSRSTFFKESGGQLRERQGRRGGRASASSDVTSMTRDGRNLLTAARFEARTTATPTTGPYSPSPSPPRSPPGRRSTLEIAWKSRIPKVFARAGLRPRLLLVRPVVPEDRRL